MSWEWNQRREGNQKVCWAVSGRGLRLIAKGGSRWAPVLPKHLLFEWPDCFSCTSSNTPTRSQPSPSRFTETCVCQFLQKKVLVLEKLVVWYQGRKGTDRKSSCGVTANGRGVGLGEGCTEEGH